jgi:hypothetical protein
MEGDELADIRYAWRRFIRKIESKSLLEEVGLDDNILLCHVDPLLGNDRQTDNCSFNATVQKCNGVILFSVRTLPRHAQDSLEK